MARRGLVERVDSEFEGRATDPVLTRHRWEALKAAPPKHVAWVCRVFFSGLEDGDEAELADLLSAVYQTIIRARRDLPPPAAPASCACTD
jgi:DNA-binding MarR family transcriptional regulator